MERGEGTKTSVPGIRLTEWAHGGGCGCKIAPAVLQRLLGSLPPGLCPPELLVGTEASDDAAVYRLREDLAIVATTDFFTPVVDDPYDFGRIAATNALSDVYAMGGRPILALAIVGMPVSKLPEEAITRILEGGASVCREAGIPLAGGHSIDTVEPIYGLVALGVVHPEQVKTNGGARPGDVLILSKPLGIGILSAALKQGRLSGSEYAEMRLWTMTLNRAGRALASREAVHAMTDVTGFGLAGHLLEVCRASGVAAVLDREAIPVLASARRYAEEGVATGASKRNWASYGEEVDLSALADEESEAALWRTLLTDPQTSGGLLIACAPEAAEGVIAEIRAHQALGGWKIGEIVESPVPRVVLR